MSKQTGLGETISVDSAAGTPEAISNDVTNWTISTPRAVQDTTGVNKSAMERALLLADCSITLNGVFNPGVSPSAHDVLKTVPSSGVSRTYTMIIETSASSTLTAEQVITDYQITRPQSGELTWQAPSVLQNGTAPVWS